MNKMKTEFLITKFYLKHSNPSSSDFSIYEENGNLILHFEGIAHETFPMTEDFEEWVLIQQY